MDSKVKSWEGQQQRGRTQPWCDSVALDEFVDICATVTEGQTWPSATGIQYCLEEHCSSVPEPPQQKEFCWPRREALE